MAFQSKVKLVGDVTGDTSSASVIKIQGVSCPSPSGTNTVLTYSGSSLSWAAPSITLTGDVTTSGTTATVVAISGSTPIVITPSELQWKNTTTTPLIDQAALASTSSGSGTAGVNLTITSQAGQAATGASHNGGAGGNLVINSGIGGTSGSATGGNSGFIKLNYPFAATGAVSEGGIQVTKGGSVLFTLANRNDQGNTDVTNPVLWFGSSTSISSTGGTFIKSTSGNLGLNAASGGVEIDAQGVTYIQMNSGRNIQWCGTRYEGSVSKTSNYSVVSGNSTTQGDSVIFTDSTSSAFTITLPASPVMGDTYIVKDKGGNALTNNITVSGNGHNIDGASTYAINTNYGAITVVYNGSTWSAICKSL